MVNQENAKSYCSNCGSELSEDASFCPGCGKALESEQSDKSEVNSGKTNIYSILGLIFAFLLPLVGLILSIIALKQTKKRNQAGMTMAIWGTVISSVFLFFQLIIFAALILTTFSGIQQQGRDTERQTDIRALHSMVEAFYAQNGGGYPVLADFNDATWRSINMQGLDPTALCDPNASNQTSCNLVDVPSLGSYSYQTWEADGVTPCKKSSPGSFCAKYTLTAPLEGTVNGLSFYSKQSLN